MAQKSRETSYDIDAQWDIEEGESPRLSGFAPPGSSLHQAELPDRTPSSGAAGYHVPSQSSVPPQSGPLGLMNPRVPSPRAFSSSVVPLRSIPPVSAIEEIDAGWDSAAVGGLGGDAPAKEDEDAAIGDAPPVLIGVARSDELDEIDDGWGEATSDPLAADSPRPSGVAERGGSVQILGKKQRRAIERQLRAHDAKKKQTREGKRRGKNHGRESRVGPRAESPSTASPSTALPSTASPSTALPSMAKSTKGAKSAKKSTQRAARREADRKREAERRRQAGDTGNRLSAAPIGSDANDDDAAPVLASRGRVALIAGAVALGLVGLMWLLR